MKTKPALFNKSYNVTDFPSIRGLPWEFQVAIVAIIGSIVLDIIILYVNSLVSH
jgi:hypothetical protein